MQYCNTSVSVRGSRMRFAQKVIYEYMLLLMLVFKIIRRGRGNLNHRIQQFAECKNLKYSSAIRCLCLLKQKASLLTLSN